MPDVSDALLEAALRRALDADAASLPADDWRRRVRAEVLRRGQAERTRGRGVRRLLVLGLAAAFILPIGVFLSGASPAPVPPAAGYAAVFVQPVPRDDGYGSDMRVFTADGTGSPRQIASIPAAAYEWYLLNHPAELNLSTTGRLAVRTGGKTSWNTLVFDLKDPGTKAQLYPYRSIAFDPLGRVWIPKPDGEFTQDLPISSFEVVDPATQAAMSVEVPEVLWKELGIGRSGYGPFSTDGQMIVASERQNGRASRLWPSFSLLGTDSVLESDQRGSALDWAWRGPRWFSPTGGDLAVCETDELCGAATAGGVRAGPTRGDGTWYDGANGPALDASWDSDGSGMWLLSKGYSRNPDSEPATLLHLEEPRVGSPRDRLDSIADLSFARTDLGVHILALAPDDSLIAVGPSMGDDLDGRFAIVDTDDGSVTYQRGSFAGFASASLFASAQ